MIAWFLSIWSWFSKLSWVVKIISFVPVVKQYWHFIVIGVLILYIGLLKIEFILAENRYLKLKTQTDAVIFELREAKSVLEAKQSSAIEIINKNSDAANAKIEAIKKARDENGSAVDILRSHF